MAGKTLPPFDGKSLICFTFLAFSFFYLLYLYLFVFSSDKGFRQFSFVSFRANYIKRLSNKLNLII